MSESNQASALPLLPGGIDPLAAPGPSWLATASPADIDADRFIRAELVRLSLELGLIPRSSREFDMARAVLKAAAGETR